MARLWQDGDYIDVSPLTDKELDTYSDNSVANSTVTKELNKKANENDLSKVAKSNDYNDLDNKPNIDSTPTKGSNNLITSGGVEAITTALNNSLQGFKIVTSSYGGNVTFEVSVDPSPVIILTRPYGIITRSSFIHTNNLPDGTLMYGDKAGYSTTNNNGKITINTPDTDGFIIVLYK